MKKASSIVLLYLLCSPLTIFAATEFHEGTLCDSKAGFCADSYGVSVALTKMYLGDVAEQKLLERIQSLGKEYFDPSRFTLSDGITCWVEEKTCWSDRNRTTVHTKATQTLFGK